MVQCLLICPMCVHCGKFDGSDYGNISLEKHTCKVLKTKMWSLRMFNSVNVHNPIDCPHFYTDLDKPIMYRKWMNNFVNPAGTANGIIKRKH